MARVSVIVPTYNRVGYLGETVASILNQDYRDFELIVADNASTDATASLLAGIADPRLRHVRRAQNIGWRANFNQSLHDTETDYVALVGDDDRLLPGALTRAVTFLDQTPGAGLVHTSFNIIDGGGEVIELDRTWGGYVAEDRLQRGTDFIVRSMHSYNSVCLSSVVMRTAALPEVCFEAADDVTGDFVLHLRIALDWDIGFLATSGVELRVHDGQLSQPFDRTDRLNALRDSKLRFLSTNAARLDDVGALRRAARDHAAAELSSTASREAHESRTIAIRALGQAARDRPQLVLAPRSWRTASKIVLGPRGLRYIQSLRTRPS